MRMGLGTWWYVTLRGRLEVWAFPRYSRIEG